MTQRLVTGSEGIGRLSGTTTQSNLEVPLLYTGIEKISQYRVCPHTVRLS